MSATKASRNLCISMDTNLLKKETENVFTSGIKSPAIPGRHLWLWPRCTALAWFIRKMSPAWHSPAFPVSQVFPVFGIQVRAAVGNTLALLYWP